MFRHVSGFLKRNAHNYVLGVIVLLLVDVLNLLIPKVLEAATDYLTRGGTGSYQVWHYAAAILMLGVGIAVSRFLWRFFIFITAVRFESYVRLRLFSHWLTMPRSYFNKVQTGDLMARATNDVQALRQASSMGIIAVVDAVFLTITTLIVMVTDIDPMMTLLAVLPLPVILIIITLTTRKMFAYSKASQEGFARLSGKAQESFSGIKVIKSFVQEDNELNDFNEKSRDNMNRAMKLVRIRAMLDPVVTFVSTLSLVIALIVGSIYVVDGSITLGKFVSFLKYLELLTWPMMAFGFFVALVQGGAASLDRINAVLDEKSDLADYDTGMMPKDRSIEIRNLNFTYPGESEPVLKDINLSVPSGSTLGVLGHTGSGKTTLISILLKLYNVDRGMVFIGGVDINDISLKNLRDLFGVVPQDNFLFSDTIANNIALSSDDVDENLVRDTARQAHVEKDIMEFPLGFDTVLGEKGVNLSGGQKQRTSIARMFYKNSKINVLDDSLSAVDTITESAIIESLEKRRGKNAEGSTNIIISHRISSIISADQIIVLENGKIAEKGTHNFLLLHGGLYADVYTKQKLEEKIRRA
ncbi:MAG: ABC transporter ATP-binding protein [Bacillota bacterium]|nr:ABC transporter ATP-binding protein [Bacillota bacterium]